MKRLLQQLLQRRLLLLLLALCGSGLGEVQAAPPRSATGAAAAADAPGAGGAADRPGQRWLPLPYAQPPDVGQQRELLQQLDELLRSQWGEFSPPDMPLPTLGAEQRQQLEQALRLWREAAAEHALLDSWETLAEEDRQGAEERRPPAQQLLEAYARNRRLPRPRSAATQPRDSSVALPQNPASANDRAATPSTPPNGSRRGRTAEQPGSRLPPGVEPQVAPSGPNTSSPNTSGPDPFTTDPFTTDPFAADPFAADPLAADPLAGEPLAGKSFETERDPAAAGPTTEDSQGVSAYPQVGLQRQAGRSGQLDRDLGGMPAAQAADLGANGAQPSETAEASARHRSSAARSPSFSRLGGSSRSSGARPGTETEEGSVSEARAGRESEADWETGPMSGRTAPLAGKEDIKEQFERHGLAAALRRIVEKTLQEQARAGDAELPSAATASASAEVASAAAPRLPVELPKGGLSLSQATDWAVPRQAGATPMGPGRPGATRGPASSNDSSPRPSQERSAATPAPGWQDMLSGIHESDLWQAISKTPSRAQPQSAGALASADSVRPGRPGLEFHWGGRSWLLFLIAALLLALAILFVRRHLRRASVVGHQQTAWVRQVLQSGIRTRADVVRAFHHYLTIAPQPTAEWWTHRYAAQRLVHGTPHLGSALQEFANLYEQARYLPPEVELSSAQIDRVQLVLRQCCDAPAAV
ncbi:MAG: hypothetical protein KDA45_04645 [Planctomycetales bacterium]|nr:hypothetical protein [Planctomycetales bacterium]